MSEPEVPQRAPVPRGTIRIGRLAGIDVLVTSSWFLIAALIVYVMAPRVDEVQAGLGGWKYVVGLAYAIALYLAVLLHEASHAVVARMFGFPVESITLSFLGGSTAMVGPYRRPRQEFWIAVVGPITSLLVGAAALGLWFAVPDGVGRLVLEGLAAANLVMGVLNLVPGLPLDGGRVLKAGVWAATGRVHTGTIAAAWGGRLTAAATLLGALLLVRTGNFVDAFILGVIAFYLWTAAGQSLTSATIVRRLGEVVPRDLARPTLSVPDDLPLAEAVRRAKEAGAGSIVTVTSDGRPIGVVDEQAVNAMPEDRRPWVAVSTVARSLAGGRALPASVTGAELLAALRNNPASEYVLMAEDGSVYGVLSAADVAREVQR